MAIKDSQLGMWLECDGKQLIEALQLPLAVAKCLYLVMKSMKKHLQVYCDGMGDHTNT